MYDLDARTINGMLGNQGAKYYYTPTLLPLPEKIARIHGGIFSTAALSESGNWYMWGDNTFGGLCTGDMKPTKAPVKLSTPVIFADIAPGMAHSLALAPSGEVYLWGNFRTGGDEVLIREVTPDDLRFRKVNLPEKINKIEAGDSSCYALSATGNLYVWGEDQLGALGLGSVHKQPNPVVVMKSVKDFVLSPQPILFSCLIARARFMPGEAITISRPK